jgi:hypothetical protein
MPRGATASAAHANAGFLGWGADGGCGWLYVLGLAPTAAAVGAIGLPSSSPGGHRQLAHSHEGWTPAYPPPARPARARFTAAASDPRGAAALRLTKTAMIGILPCIAVGVLLSWLRLTITMHMALRKFLGAPPTTKLKDIYRCARASVCKSAEWVLALLVRHRSWQADAAASGLMFCRSLPAFVGSVCVCVCVCVCVASAASGSLTGWAPCTHARAAGARAVCVRFVRALPWLPHAMSLELRHYLSPVKGCPRVRT